LQRRRNNRASRNATSNSTSMIGSERADPGAAAASIKSRLAGATSLAFGPGMSQTGGSSSRLNTELENYDKVEQHDL